MTQQPEQAAVGGDEPIIAAEATIEDRFAAVSGDEAEEAPEKPEGELPEEPTDEIDEPDDEPSEAEESDEDPAPIAPPVSWTGENKDKFAQLPRDVQEYIAERETDRERFVQTKAQEAKQARSTVEREALTVIQSATAQHQQSLNALKVQLPERPSYQLQAEDPYAFAEQADAYDRAVAHNHWIEQQVESTRAMNAQAQRESIERTQAETRDILQEKFPEYLSAEHGPKLREELGSVAIELGFTAEELKNPDARDILAMRHVANLKVKAEKYDKLMAKQMEGVRAAKSLPKVSRPGVAQGKGAAVNQRYAADRHAMKQGDNDAANRVFSRFV